MAGLVTLIKNGLKKVFDKLLTKEIKEELGFNKRSLHSLATSNKSIDSELNSFWKPVESQILTSKDYKRAQSWTVALIVFLTLVLLVLFFSLLVPKKKYTHMNKGTVVLVQGEAYEEKILETENTEDLENLDEELLVESLDIEGTDDDLAKNSPLLKSESTNLMEYEVKSGDTLEKIAYKFYGSSSPDLINKIKTANKITNSRLLQIGRKLIIPI